MVRHLDKRLLDLRQPDKRQPDKRQPDLRQSDKRQPDKKPIDLRLSDKLRFALLAFPSFPLARHCTFANASAHAVGMTPSKLSSLLSSSLLISSQRIYPLPSATLGVTGEYVSSSPHSSSPNSSSFFSPATGHTSTCAFPGPIKWSSLAAARETSMILPLA